MKTPNLISIKNSIHFILICVLIASCLVYPTQLLALNPNNGKDIFIQHCAGCHIGGGNIIRRRKTLKMSDLKRNGIDNPEEIARIARLGIGSMSGYGQVIGEQGDKAVANWIWDQAQKAWVQE